MHSERETEEREKDWTHGRCGILANRHWTKANVPNVLTKHKKQYSTRTKHIYTQASRLNTTPSRYTFLSLLFGIFLLRLLRLIRFDLFCKFQLQTSRHSLSYVHCREFDSSFEFTVYFFHSARILTNLSQSNSCYFFCSVCTFEPKFTSGIE